MIIAIACGILAILLLNIYLKKKEEDIVRKARQAQQPAQQPAMPVQQMAVVLVAQKDIPTQVLITPSDVAMREVPVDYIQPGVVTSIEQLIGQVASSPIAAGEQILQTKLMPPGNIGKTLSEITPQGKRAVTVSVEDTSGSSSLIRSGDHVDVFAFLTPPTSLTATTATATTGQKKTEASLTQTLVPLFQNIEVLAVGGDFVTTAEVARFTQQQKEPAARGLSSSGTGAVTLALSPQEAVLISFVQEHGRIKLILRSAEDTNKEAIKPADWDTLFQYLYPERAAVDAEASRRPTVEIYRGLRKEIVPLSEKGK